MSSLIFSPLLPLSLLYTLLFIGLFIITLLVIKRTKGALLRLIILSFLAIILLNPLQKTQIEQSAKSIVAIVIDESASQKIGSRMQDNAQILQVLKNKIKNYENLELRIIYSKDNDNSQTLLFQDLFDSIKDIPPSRIAGAIFVTDGQVHDVPSLPLPPQINFPINALITGNLQEKDRKIHILQSPRFGPIKTKISVQFQVEDHGLNNQGQKIPVDIVLNGKILQKLLVNTGEKQTIKFSLSQTGKNILQIITPVVPGEINPANNQAVLFINGLEKNMRVLLISGAPYNGERLWRNLLKSDVGTDLIHFTILRTPENADHTPLKELALIALPITDLFVNKIKKFDLVILDRYEDHNILPKLYYEYIADYVKTGGALLTITGPEFAQENSLAKTPLRTILPALPDGNVFETPFQPTCTETGKKHPITKELIPSEKNNFGRWLRQIGVNPAINGQILLKGVQGKPLLIVNKVEKGRIALLLSDESWLWAKGFEGGGPYLSFYRNIAHWLMQRLQEENLQANINGKNLNITRQTMLEAPPKLTIIPPHGPQYTVLLTKVKEGIFSTNVDLKDFGLYKIINGDLQTETYYGPQNNPEFSDMLSTIRKLAPICQATKGTIFRVHPSSAEKFSVPDISFIADKDKIFLQPTKDKIILDIQYTPIFPQWLILILGLISFFTLWWKSTKNN